MYILELYGSAHGGDGKILLVCSKGNRKRYEVENSLEKQWLMPASKAIQSLSNSQMEDLIATLKTKAKGIAKKTGIDSSLARN